MDKSEKGSSQSTSGTRTLFDISVAVDGRASCVLASEDQTPLVNNTGRRNFSGLAKIAPANYFTLQQKGVLDAVGTLTSKFRPFLMMVHLASADDEEYVQVLDSPTRSFGRVQKLEVAPKEIQCELEGF